MSTAKKTNNTNINQSGNGALTPPATGITTRRSSRATLTQEEIEKIPNTVTNIDTAEDYLSKNLLCHVGKPYTLTHLISVLFHATQLKGVPLPAASAMRAADFILKKHTAYHVIAALAPQIAKVLNASKTMAGSENEVQTAAGRIEAAADALYESVKDCHNAMKLLSPSLDSTQQCLNTLSTQLTDRSTRTHVPQNSQLPAPSYSSITAAHLSPTIDQAVARAAIRARQIILDPSPGGTMFPPGTPHENIVKTIKEALATIRNYNTPPGDIRAVTTFHNGGLIVELENEHLAAWLRTPEGRSTLGTQLGPTVSFCNRSFPLVAEYLPIQMQIDNKNFLSTVEQENGLPANSLMSI
ncbi:hypothetical protein DFH29DRAFT_1000959 [Suillus ampliporus]|nr:hypothetical protein DFH29DRAFT_1000959 [Suillus ampliporus]